MPSCYYYLSIPEFQCPPPLNYIGWTPPYFSHLMFARFIFLAFYQFILVLLLLFGSASEMTYIVSGGALNSTHSLTITFRPFVQGGSKGLLIIICGPNQ